MKLYNSAHMSLTEIPFTPVPIPARSDRPVPIPAPGVQLTTLSHVEDVASMLAAVPGNKKAVHQMYNVCSDRCITFQARGAAL